MDDVFLDWTVPAEISSATAVPNTHEGSGVVLDIVRYDSLYTPEGDKIVLPAGQGYKNKDRKAKDYNKAIIETKMWNTSHQIEYTRLEIRSPHMKAALKNTVPAYQNIEIGFDHICMTDKPRCLFHYRTELQAYGRNIESTDSEAARHVHFLLSYMWDQFLHESISYFTTVEMVTDAPASLEFEYLWMLFRPGDVVYVPKNKSIAQHYDSAFIFEDMSLECEQWTLTGFRIDYGYRQFGHVKEFHAIPRYLGPCALQDLSVIPMQYIPDFQKIQERLIARGKTFISMHEKHYYWYEGLESILKKPKSRVGSGLQLAKGRVMIDQDGYHEVNRSGYDRFESSKAVFYLNDSAVKMTDNQLVACSGTVGGYFFKDNDWGRFHLDGLTDMTLDSAAFDSLILEPEYKQQILSLVRVHEDERLKFDDLIKGKGKGMVFLLYGEPGTGKTLTAESIADHCRKPLLRLDAGVLGTTVNSVEERLSKAFQLAESWHAVVLIDEADVFLEQRGSQNLVHNGLVSVFLRMLEYYQGILVLTTNRIDAIDRAFRSRIHLAIHYPPLSHASRLELWKTFLLLACPDAVEDLISNHALEQLAGEELNGRQIKNLVRTASAMAISDQRAQGKISPRHIHSALRPMKAFEAGMSSELGSEGQGDVLARQSPEMRKRRIHEIS